ncbi:MAG: branched-chain amino acid aminotransferase [Pseudomonadota bacterium]
MSDFDDRDGYIWLDGKCVDWRQAKCHVLTHSLHYGSAVFEGERAYNGKIYELEAHSKRLIKSAEMAGYKVPYSHDEISKATKEILAKSGFSDAYIRPVAWRGSQEMGLAARKNKIHVAIACWQWPSYFTFQQRMKGVRMDIAEWRRPSPQCAPVHSKMGGLYAICTMAKHAAEEKGYDDALFLDYRGLVAEGTGANIFFVIDNVLHTPETDCFLDGITRQSVIRIAREKGLKTVTRYIKPEEMAKASEAFLTGTAIEVTPISQIAEYHFNPGNVCQTLMEAYEQETHQ